MAVKTETLTIKVSPEEKEKIKQLAEAADMTVSKYLYRKLFGGQKDEVFQMFQREISE
jgi:predicted transcriptional regulator